MSAAVYYEPNRLPAGILALLVHSIFFALLYFGFNWNRQAFVPATMSVELWKSLPEEAVVPPPKVEEVAPPRPQPEVMAKPDIAMPEKEKEKAKLEKMEAERRSAEAVKKKEAEQRAAEEVRKKEAAKQKAAAQKAAEQKQAAQRIADEQAAAQKAEQARLAEQAAATGRVVDEYLAKIQAKIRRNVRNPPGVAKDASAEFLVTLLPGGSVLKAELNKSSGNPAYDNAVERAILKSDPLPLPPDATLFNRFRELHMTFKPEKQTE